MLYRVSFYMDDGRMRRIVAEANTAKEAQQQVLELPGVTKVFSCKDAPLGQAKST